LQHGFAVHRIRYVFHSCQPLSIKGWKAFLCVNGGLQRGFLRGAAQLPLPQRKRQGDHQHGRQRQHQKTRLEQAGTHARIIRFMNYLVALAFLAILASLASALFFMLKDGTGGKAKTSNMARALAFRVGFSIVLFICILIAWKMGYIQPTGIPAGK
jgi:hypothetical protein